MDQTLGCYVDLDSLLDTRIATIAKVGGEAALERVKPFYHLRTSDLFGQRGTSLTQEAYDASYATRDEETLALSRMTFVPVYLLHLISKFTTTKGMPVLASGIKVTVNTFPYNLPEERQRGLVNYLQEYTGGAADIELIDVDPAKLSLAFLKANYKVFFVYEFDRWLMGHTEEFKTTQIPDVSVLTPRVMLKDVTEEARQKGLSASGFESTSVALFGFVTVVFLDVRLFSYVTDTPPSLEG